MDRQQSGFALLIFVILILGIGGVALAGLGKELVNSVTEQRLQHNRRVLNEAKQALLMYAYRHPQFNNSGPGRLPCPDDDNDGLIGSANPTQCTSVGRLPWADGDLDFYEARDASNEHLWYAVSDSFDNLGGGGPNINSSSQGSITLFDQTGTMIYDGTAAGLAAVIIAPGDPIARDENNDGIYEYTQVRSTAADRLDPANYLDTFGGFDNSGFNNGESDTDDDGFIQGPVIDPAQNVVVVNDQIAVITTDELIAYAERGVLQAYKDALESYQDNTGGVYPWLFDYNINVAANNLDTSYPASTLGGVYPIGAVSGMGRIPSIFTPYFTNESDSEAFASEIGIQMTLGYTLSGTDYTITLDDVSSVSDQVVFSPGIGRFNLNVQNTGDTLEYEFYYYRIFGGWNPCGEELSDCPAGVIFFSGDVLKVGLRADLTVDFAVSFDTPVPSANFSYSPPGIVAGPTATHAFVRIFDSWSEVNDFPGVQLYYEQDDDFDGTFIANSSGQQNAHSGDNLGPVISPGITSAGVGVRYYPEIPRWALVNDWHIGIQMAIADDHLPGGDGDCSDSTCLSIADLGGTNDNKAALLVLAGSHLGITDDGNDGFNNDLDDLFEGNNDDLADAVFDHRSGNDSTLILQDN